MDNKRTNKQRKHRKKTFAAEQKKRNRKHHQLPSLSLLLSLLLFVVFPLVVTLPPRHDWLLLFDLGMTRLLCELLRMRGSSSGVGM